MAPRRHRPTFPAAPALALATLFLLSGGLGGLGALRGSAGAPGSGLASGHGTPAPLLPMGGGGHRPPALPAGPRPASSNDFYTQIGSTLAELNHSVTITGVRVLSEEIPLVVSPYSTGYELNLLSDSGDWYQVVVGDNWPGCNAGFEEIIEIWDDQGNTGPVMCDPTISMSVGNVIVLNASLPNLSTGCLGLDDTTTGHSHVYCQAQPNSGGTAFDLLSSSSNSNGYYTGTMTEIVNFTATSCPDYRLLPTVTFDYPKWADFTSYTAWSDEWNNIQGGSFCYSASDQGLSIPPLDPASVYDDSTGGSIYGPQLTEGQNDTLLNPSVGFRFQSDPVRITAESINASSRLIAPGGTSELHATTTGGIAPYGALWVLNGIVQGGRTGLYWNFSTLTPGNYTITVYGTDAQGDASPPASVTIVVPYPLKVSSVRMTPGPGADVGESVTFSASVSGGYPPLSYAWTGLPSGCLAANAASVRCAPNAAGSTTVDLRVTPTNGSTVPAGPLPLVVSPELAVSIGGVGSVGDVGQTPKFQAIVSGGSGGTGLRWSDLPGGCVAAGASAPCTLSVPGEFIVTVSANDSNGVTVISTALTYIVDPTLSVSLAASRYVLDAGVAIALSAAARGGAGGDAYTWSGLPGGCAGADQATVTCTPSEGETAIGVSVLDAAGAQANATAIAVDVVPALSLSLRAAPLNSTAPGTFTITPNATGGTPVGNVTWIGLPAGCAEGLGLTPLHCAGLPAGNYLIVLKIDDQGGGNASASVELRVASSSDTPTAAPPTSLGPIAIGLGLLLLILIGVGVAGARRAANRRARRTEAPAAPAERLYGEPPR